MRQRQFPLLERELSDPESTNRAVAEGAKRLSQRGYRPQVHRRVHDVNFFYMLDNVRCRLVHRGKRLIVEHPTKRTTVASLSMADLPAHAQRHVLNFSPNVIMRPLVQDFILPTVAYVAGPAEFTYLAQIQPVYELFGVTPAAPVLRPMVTLLSTGARQVLERFGAWDAFLTKGLSGVLEHVAQGDARLGEVLRRIREHEDILQQELSTLGNSLTADHPHLAVAFEKTRQHVSHGLKKLRERIIRQFRLPDTELCRDLCSVFTEIAPMASVQERILSPLSFGYELTPAELAEVLARTLESWRPQADPLILGLQPRSGRRRVSDFATVEDTSVTQT